MLTEMRQIPLVDLAWQHRVIEAEVRRGWEKVLADSSYILGEPVARFEQAFSEFGRVRHCVGVANGTDALELALRATGIGPGDEVVLPANTFIATALAVSRLGATPVLADCDADTHLLTPQTLNEAVTSRTRAIVPVHLYGQMAPVEQIRAAYPNLIIVEDGAQSQGATRRGQTLGSVGDAVTTSFYPGKNIGAYGDAGAVLANDDEIAGRVRALRNWGSDVKYFHPVTGFNSRMDTLQAVVLLAKLSHLDRWNRDRAAQADRYTDLLGGLPIGLPKTLDGNTHVWHLYVIQVEKRGEVLEKLHQAGVGAGVHYPIPIHLQDAYADLGYVAGSFPNTERLAGSAISLPIHPGLSADDQEYVVQVLRDALGGS
jgi:dTDP-4-amino-4,6-dideoxygalactose transaminase